MSLSENRLRVHELTADLCVVGGGMAGVCAAVAAARLGSKVVLVQDRSVLGGNASSEIKMHIVGADCHGERPGARETGLTEEFRLEDAVRNPHRSYSQWDLLLYEKVISEPLITLLLNASCVTCQTSDEAGRRTIQSVTVERPSTEELFEIEARFFADCSGDGRLGQQAGADFRVGREAKSEYGESLALDEADGETLGSSILFTAREYGEEQFFKAPDWIRKFEKSELELRPIQDFGYGYWWAEWGGQMDTIRDNEIIRHELLRIALGVWDYVKNSGEHPGSANWALDWVGSVPGKRESRRFLGPHVLTQDDVLSGRLFDDCVAYGGWWIDLHPPSGVDRFEDPPCMHQRTDGLYGIPLRSLYSRNVSNLFFAGRNMSATHVAFSSTRVMATCAVMGQAIGTTAAVLNSKEISGPDLADPETIQEIQQALLKHDAYLPGLHSQDEADLAVAAQLSSSSGSDTVSRVVNGVGRDTHGEWSATIPEAENAWVSDEIPAWVELEWTEPQSLREVHLTFCTGLHRELILSASDSTTKRVVRGPQPETIRAYKILCDGKEILSVEDNYLRKRIHRLEFAVATNRLRVVATKTWGAETARIFEVRAY